MGSDNAQTPISIYAFKATRPKREFDEIVVHHGQHEIYLPGKDRWGPVEFSFYEAIGQDNKNSIAKFFWGWQKEVSDRLTANIGKFVGGFKKNIEYEMNAPVARGSSRSQSNCVTPVWKYILWSAWPIRVNPSDLDYTDNSISEMSVEIRFDAAQEM